MPGPTLGAMLALLRGAPATARIGLAIVAVYAVLAVLAPAIAPYGEREIVAEEYAAPSPAHPLGTDNLGRDMVSRLIWGARNSIGIALVTTLLAFLAGSATGLAAGTLGGVADRLMGMAADVLMAIPSLILALLLLTIFGSSIPVLVGIIAALEATRVFRLARALAVSIAAAEFIDAARLRGEGFLSMVAREVLPNAAAPLAAEFGLRFCFVFLFIASLSFLGIGIQPPRADWGSMVRENASLITYGDLTPLLPAAAIALLTIGVNLVIDWVLHRMSHLRD